MPALESEDALQLALVRRLEPETFYQRRLSRLEKLQLFVLHRTSLELRDNSEAIPLERAADVRAVAAVSGWRARRRTVASSVYDYFEFFAEIDLLCALSTCPHGDMTIPTWGPNAADPITICRPIGVEVYSLKQELLAGWKTPAVSDYGGTHGLNVE